MISMYKARISDMNEDGNNRCAQATRSPGHYRAKNHYREEGRTKEKGRLPRESSTRATAVALSIVLSVSRKVDCGVG